MKYGYKDYEKFKTLGKCILLEKMVESENRMSHGLYLPESKRNENNKIGVGKILDIGKIAQRETNLNIGDYVLYDYWSVFNDESINVLTNYENIIIKLDGKKDATDFLNGELLV